MQKFSDTVATSVNGQLIILSAATVNVYLTGTTTPASIYSTNVGAAKSNPFQSSATGLIEFYAADGRYDIVVSKAGYATVTVADQLFEDPSDGTDDDLASIAITNSTIDSTEIGGSAASTGKFTGVRLDTAAPAASLTGQFRWNDTDGTPEVRLKGGLVDLQIGQEQVVRIYNNTGSPFSDMQVVRVTGSQGQRLTASLAQANSEATSSKTFAVVTEPIANNSEGFATTSGLVRDVNTAAFAEGAALWLSPSVAGGVTTTKPQAPDHSVLVGWCVRSHATLGSIFVHVQNGHELDELHDVKITALANDQILQYKTASGTWENVTLPFALSGPLASSGITGAAASGANTDITSLASPAIAAATATTQAGTDNTTKVATTAMVQAALIQSGKILKVQSFTDGGSGTTSTSAVNLNGSLWNYTPVSNSSTLYLFLTGQCYTTALGSGAGFCYFWIGEYTGVYNVRSSGIGLQSQQYSTTYAQQIYTPLAIQVALSNTSTSMRQFDIMGASWSASVTAGASGTLTIIEVKN